ncbi:hypothetical protein BH24DEI1_BH24DEI1_07480 [soil metagenome]
MPDKSSSAHAVPEAAAGSGPDGVPPGISHPAWQWFGFLGGIVAWALQFAISYVLTEVACNSDRLAFTVLGVGATEFLSLMVTLLAGLTAIIAAVVAYLSQPQGVLGDAVEKAGAPEASGRSRFMAYFGVVINGIFLLAILAGGLPFFFLRTC